MIKKVLLIVSFILFTVALPAQDRNVKEEKTGLDTRTPKIACFACAD